MKKHILSLILALTLTLGLAGGALAAEPSSTYDTYLAQFQTAYDSQDYAGIVRTAAMLYDISAASPTEERYQSLLRPTMCAAQACEVVGDLDGAELWLARGVSIARWLDDNTDSSYHTFLTIQHFKQNALSSRGEIYTATTQPVRWYGACNEPMTGFYYGTPADGSIQDNESAAMVYVTFDDGYSVEYWVRAFEGLGGRKVTTALNGDAVMELAWNIDNRYYSGADDYLTQIINGSFDEYIITSAQYMGSLNTKILLRLFAEVNCWSVLPTPALYIGALRHITDLVRAYTDNVAIVYSPNCVSNLRVDYNTYYPGDNYVDWVGISLYSAVSSSAMRSPLDYTYGGYDAFNLRGNYSSALLYLKELVDTFGDRKPLMISESGYAYYTSSGGYKEAGAINLMQNVYAYVNMLYPQIKLVGYFDVEMKNEPNRYFLNGSAAYRQAYLDAIGGNGGLLTSLHDTAVNYTPLDSWTESAGTALTVYTCLQLPVTADTIPTCTYTLDGVQVHTTQAVPYAYTVDVGGLSVGEHTLSATVSAVNSWGYPVSRTVTRSLYKRLDGTVVGTAKQADNAFGDDNGSGGWSWASDYVYACAERGIVAGFDDGTFRPDGSVTRAQFVTMLARAAGVTAEQVSTAGNPFWDATADWYAYAVVWAAQSGITNGVDAGTFAPDAPVTREQVVTFLYRYLRAFAGAQPASADLSAYWDGGQVDSWAQEGMTYCVAHGIVNGTSPTTLEPLRDANRAQAAKIFACTFLGL